MRALELVSRPSIFRGTLHFPMILGLIATVQMLGFLSFWNGERDSN